MTVNSVIFWDPTKLEWKQGPILNGARKDHAVVVCNDAIYAIGGECSELQFMEEEGGGGWHVGMNHTTLDTIERLEISDLVQKTQ